MRAIKNYAGHRLSPWLGHLMISRQETARPLLTPGEVMQLPQDEELVLVSGAPPIRAKKARYYEDKRFSARILPPPRPSGARQAEASQGVEGWLSLPSPRANPTAKPIAAKPAAQDDSENSGVRREPMLPAHEAISPEIPASRQEFAFAEDQPDRRAVTSPALGAQMGALARQVSLDPGDGLQL